MKRIVSRAMKHLVLLLTILNLLHLAFVDLLILLILKFCVLIAMVVVVLGLSFLDSVQVPHLVPMRHAIVL